MTIKKTRLSDEEAQAAGRAAAGDEAEIVVPGVRETSGRGSLHASSNNNNPSPSSSPDALEPDIVVKPSAKKVSSLEVEQGNSHDALATNDNMTSSLPSAFYCPITKRVMVGPRHKRFVMNQLRRTQ